MYLLSQAHLVYYYILEVIASGQTADTNLINAHSLSKAEPLKTAQKWGEI